jgi:hypothetical protein
MTVFLLLWTAIRTANFATTIARLTHADWTQAGRIAPSSGAAGRTEETLLIAWPPGEAGPTKYWLSNLDHRMSFRRLVDMWPLSHDEKKRP